MNKIFDIEYTKLVRWLTPTPLQKMPIYKALIQACIMAIAMIYYVFKNNRNNNLYNIAITPQVCYMEKILNDKYDPQHRIYIDNYIQPVYRYIYLEIEKNPQFLFKEIEKKPIILYRQESIKNKVNVDFEVNIPNEILTDKESEINELLSKIKLPTKKYILQKI